MIYFLSHIIIFFSLWLMSFGNIFLWCAVGIIFILFPLIEFSTQSFLYIPDVKPKNIILGELSLLLMPASLTLIMIYGFVTADKIDNLFNLTALGLSCGVLMGAFGITSAHELIHRRSKVLRALGVYNLMLVNFAHWGLEHVYGHHKNVATPLDPASAKKNEIIYLFWFREYFGSLKSAYNINSVKFIAYWSFSFVSGVLVNQFLGQKILFFWVLVSITAALLLQTVDYIEHYGLTRKELAPGKFEPFSAKHAWDTDSWLTNVILFNLGLHSFHHDKASIPFESLKPQSSAPRMPIGYSFMVVLALIPFAFLPLMNKKISEFK